MAYKCREVHGYLLKDAKGTPEGRAFQAAYHATKACLRRWSKHYFEIERDEWFSSQDARAIASARVCEIWFKMCSLLILAQVEQPTNLPDLDGCIIMPDEHQEDDLENLDLNARFVALGHIDVNNMTGQMFADVLESGVLEHVVDVAVDKALSSPQPSSLLSPSLPAVPAEPESEKRIIEVEFDPAIHYPLNTLHMMFGQMPDNRSLEAWFKAWRLLDSLPPFKVLNRTAVTSGYYRGESSFISDDMQCTIKDCIAPDLK